MASSAEQKISSRAVASHYRQELQTNKNRKTGKELIPSEREYRVTRLRARSQTLAPRYRKDEDWGLTKMKVFLLFRNYYFSPF